MVNYVSNYEDDLAMVLALSASWSSDSSGATGKKAHSAREDGDAAVQSAATKRMRLNDGPHAAAPLPPRIQREVKPIDRPFADALVAVDPDQILLLRQLWDVVFDYGADCLPQRLLEAAELAEKEGRLGHVGNWKLRGSGPPYTHEIVLIRKIVGKQEFRANPTGYMDRWPKRDIDANWYDSRLDLDEIKDAYARWIRRGAPAIGYKWIDTHGNLFPAFKFINDFLAAEKV